MPIKIGKKPSANQSVKLMSMRAIKEVKEQSFDEDSPLSTSILKQHSLRLKELRKSGLSDEVYDIEVLNSLEELILDLLPIAEENYRKFPIHTSASAVNSYVATLNGIQSDRRALQNYNAKAERLTAIFDKACTEWTKILIENVGQLQLELKKPGFKDFTSSLQDFLRSTGKDFSSSRDKYNEQILVMMGTSKK